MAQFSSRSKVSRIATDWSILKSVHLVEGFPPEKKHECTCLFVPRKNDVYKTEGETPRESNVFRHDSLLIPTLLLIHHESATHRVRTRLSTPRWRQAWAVGLHFVCVNTKLYRKIKSVSSRRSSPANKKQTKCGAVISACVHLCGGRLHCNREAHSCSCHRSIPEVSSRCSFCLFGIPTD